MALSGPIIKNGTYTATGNSIVTTQVGFRPNSLLIWDYTAGTNALYWTDQYPAGKLVRLDTGAVVSETITITDHGFSVAASSTLLNASTDVYYWTAFRSDN